MTPKLATRHLLPLAAILALATTPALAQEVTPAQVTAAPATSVRLDIGGLDRAAVRHAVRRASVQVCKAAVKLGELDLYDGSWCVQKTRETAMGEYRRLVTAQRHAAAPAGLTVAAR